MVFGVVTLSTLASAADLLYFGIGVVAFWAGSKIWRSTNSRETNAQALSTIEILKANVEAVEKQAVTDKNASDKVIERLEKQLDDMVERNKKLEEQVRNLSVIPWERQQLNHTEIMGALAAISDGQEKLGQYLSGTKPTIAMDNEKV